MIVVFEPVCHGGEHAMFNAAMIAACLSIEGGEGVAFIGESSHLSNVRECMAALDATRVEWRPARICPRREEDVRKRLAPEWRLFGEVLEFASERNARAVMVTGTTPGGWMALKARLVMARRSRPVVAVVFHSVLGEFLYSSKRRALLSRFNPDNLRLIVLGEHIRKGALEVAPNLAPHLDSIPHPYLFDGAADRGREIGPGPISFGMVGRAGVGKGFLDFLRLVEDTAGEKWRAHARFHLAGPLSAECLDRYREFFQGPHGDRLSGGSTNRMSLHELRAGLGSLDFVVMPYNAEAYRYTASGAALDALWAVKPVLALRTPGFEELFGRLGDIGYLCLDYAELLATVRSLATGADPERYRSQCENILRGRRVFSPVEVGKNLARVLGGEGKRADPG